MKNNLAYICSPYRGNILEKARNILYARHLTKLALQLGYTPITTHLYLTQVLNDNIPMQRRQGLKAGRDILNACDTIIIGARHGITALVWNSARHFHLIENGHNLVRGGRIVGFVPGKHIMEKTRNEYENIVPQRFEEMIDEILKEGDLN